jgi:hypothetical protein
LGDLSAVTADRRPVDIPIFPCLRDHRFAGRAVLPAVEAMQILAATIPADRTDLAPTRIRSAHFDKFLVLPADAETVPALHEISLDSDGETVSKLITRTTSAKGFSRIKEHVTVRWGRGGADSTIRETGKAAPLPERLTTEPPDLFIPSDRLYAEMVPFAPAFHNLVDGVQLWPEGASAEVFAPDHTTFPGPLGSPFPLDAAFHAACAWSQRYAGIVAFPVGLGSREVLEPTRAGERYRATVHPVRANSSTLVFDIFLADETGRCRESVLGVEMRDVSGGKLAPPGWVVR